MTDEEQKLFDSYRKEVEALYIIAQILDVANNHVHGAFTGTPSERIKRQLEHLKVRGFTYE